MGKTAKVRTRKRGKSYSYIFEAGKDEHGKRKVIEKGGFPSPDDAYNAGVAAYNDWKHGNIGISSDKIMLKDFIESWLKNVAAINVRKGSLSNYIALAKNHIIPTLGGISIQDLTPADCDRWMSNQVRAGFSYNTLKIAHTILKLTLNYAVYPAQLITSNPAIYIKVPRNAPRNIVKRTIITKEMLDSLLDKQPDRSPMRIIFLLLYHTGMRIGEVLGLQWTDIDINGNIIHVSDQLRTVSKNHYLSAPKTRTSTRNIIADVELINELIHWKHIQMENELKYGSSYVCIRKNDAGLLMMQSKSIESPPAFKYVLSAVCTQENGKIILPQYVFYYLKKAGLNAHSFRHTHATMLIEAGATPRGVAGRLGHANTAITQNLYTHDTEKMQQDTAKVFQSILGEPS